MIAAALCSCSNEYFPNGFSFLENPSHSISEEKALEQLNSFISNLNNTSTKNNLSVKNKKVKSISCISAKQLLTKSNICLPEDTGSIVYIVNFESNAGYAILAADDRIDTDVISIVDSGNVYETDIDIILNPNHSLIDFQYLNILDSLDYTIHDTLFFEQEDSLVLIEPLTESVFSSYYDLYSEPLLGNAVCSDSENNPGKTVSIRLSLDYAISEIQNDDDSPNYYTQTSISYANTNIIVNPLLTGVTDRWHQDAPFNGNCPWVKPFVFARKSRKADAGCVPLAVAQILAYFKYPDVLSINGTDINWDAIRGFSFDKTEEAKKSAAVLLRHVGKVCNSLYFYGGTFTLPSYAASALEYFCFKNVVFDSYDSSNVLETLDRNCPVFICSLPSRNWHDYDFANSHGWLLDGYLSRDRIITRKHYLNGILQGEPTTSTEPQIMIHSNFGWGGSFNGYFVSGVFDLGDNDAIFDNPYFSGEKTTNYNYYLKTITYDHPKK